MHIDQMHDLATQALQLQVARLNSGESSYEWRLNSGECSYEWRLNSGESSYE